MGLLARSATSGYETEIGWPVIGQNLLVNSNFSINSRGIGSTSTTIAKNVPGLDGWYGGNAGATHTFTASGYQRTLNITSGQLCQGVWAMPPGTYMLSWAGGGTGAIVSGSPSAQVNTLGASPQLLTIAAGTAVSVLGIALTGVVTNVKLERISPVALTTGDAPAPSEYNLPDLMLDAARIAAGAGIAGAGVGNLCPYQPRTTFQGSLVGTVADRFMAWTYTGGGGATYSLPPATQYPIGQVLTVYDEAGTLSATAAIQIAPSGSDTLNGGTAAYLLQQVYGYVSFVCDGKSKWTVVDSSLYARRAIADKATTLTAGDRLVAISSITATRIITLPASSAFPPGATLTVVDESGSITSSIVVTLTPAGSDTINGGTAALTIGLPYGSLTLESNGSGKWTVVGSAGAGAPTTFFFANPVTGTYTPSSSNVVWVRARLCGGGGGGGGAGSGGANGTRGANTTLGTYTAIGGYNGRNDGSLQQIPNPGSGTFVFYGTKGGNGIYATGSLQYGGDGGASIAGNGGYGGVGPGAGGSSSAYGSGGGGGGLAAAASTSSAPVCTASGGTSGGYTEVILKYSQVAGSLAFTVGAGGTGGAAGTSGGAGGAGAPGFIAIEEFYGA